MGGCLLRKGGAPWSGCLRRIRDKRGCGRDWRRLRRAKSPPILAFSKWPICPIGDARSRAHHPVHDDRTNLAWSRGIRTEARAWTPEADQPIAYPIPEGLPPASRRSDKDGTKRLAEATARRLDHYPGARACGRFGMSGEWEAKSRRPSRLVILGLRPENLERVPRRP